MSHNYSYTDTLRSTLRISKANAKKARRLNLPQGNPLVDLKFGTDGYAPIKNFAYHGEDTGHAFLDGRFRGLVALLEGEADLVMYWESESLCGVRIRDGVFTECEVVSTLAPEKPVKKAKGSKTDDLTTIPGIRIALMHQADAYPRDPTEAEHESLGHRTDFFHAGYRAALREFAARLT